MKRVFLDFDGVLNSTGWLNRSGTNSFIDAERSHENYLLWSAQDISPKAVRRLNRLLRLTGAKVVISSSWRLIHDTEELVAMLVSKGFAGDVVGVTPSLHRDVDGNKMVRGHEIQAWLDANPGTERFIILDDEGDMAHLKDHLVRTLMKRGLLDEHVDRAIGMLLK